MVGATVMGVNEEEVDNGVYISEMNRVSGGDLLIFLGVRCYVLGSFLLSNQRDAIWEFQ